MKEAKRLEPRWKLVERVVALIERSIAPDARVLHNVELPDIVTGHPRQCDVVIKYGRPPRELTAIVEVQDRSSRVKIGTLGEWWQKMRAVGAQSLICVSALDYSQSVKDEVAKKLGPSVTLMTLRELESDEWPCLLGRRLLFRVPEASIPPGKSIGVLYGPGPLGPGSQVPPAEMSLYEEGDERPVTVVDLVVKHFDRLGPSDLPEGRHEREISIDVGKQLWAEHAGIRQAIRKLVVPIVITVHQVDLPLTVSSYEQVGHGRAIAWAATAEGTVAGEQVHFRMTFVPNAKGEFVVRGVEATRAPRGGYLLVNLGHGTGGSSSSKET